MDTSDYPSLPDLSQFHARLAANSRRVEEVIDSQIDSIERLFSAVTAQDWSVVAQMSRLLADQEPDVVGPDVVREARSVFNELSRAHDGSQPLHLPNLLDACRAVRKNRQWTL